MSKQIEWLYNPHAKPAKELSKHDQQMIQLGWDAHKTLRLDRPDYLKISHEANLGYGIDKTDVGLDRPELREKIAELIFNREYGILELGSWAWQIWAPGAKEKLCLFADQILALIPDIEDIDELRTRLTDLEKKLDDREEDLIEAKREERERIISLMEEAFKEDSDFTMLANLSALLQHLKRQALKETEGGKE